MLMEQDGTQEYSCSWRKKKGCARSGLPLQRGTELGSGVEDFVLDAAL